MATKEKIQRKKNTRVAPSPHQKKKAIPSEEPLNGSDQENVPPPEQTKGSVISVIEAEEKQDNAKQEDDLNTSLDRPSSRAHSPATLTTELTQRPPSATASPSASRAGSRPTSAAALRPSSAAGSRPGTPAGSHPGSAGRSKSPLPFPRNNTVTPVNPDPDELGSRVTLGSRNAWADENEPPVIRPSSQLSQTQNEVRQIDQSPGPSVISVSEAQPNNRVDSAPEDDVVSRVSTPVVAPPEMKGEQQAYVPFLQARDCIARIMDDMHKMKTNHIRIVHEIEGAYQSIEKETQGQFNAFVISLRRQYSSKVKTFRQVIDVHQTELTQKQTYWDGTLESLSKRNNSLLKDKKILLIKNKVEIDRLEQEKVDVQKELTHKIDELNLALVAATNERDAHWKQELEKREEEYKITHDALENEKSEVERLKQELMEARESAVIATTATVVASRKEEDGEQTSSTPATSAVEHTAAAAAAIVVTDMSKEERDRMEIERKEMLVERNQITAEREAMAKEREAFLEERVKFNEERNKLNVEKSQVEKDYAELSAKYESMRNQLGDVAQLRADYEALRIQFEVVSAAMTATSEEEKKAADEKLSKVHVEKAMMEEEKTSLEKDIEKWETEFKQENGREPTKEDRTEGVQEFYTMLHETNIMITGLDTKIDTLEQLKEGKVPEAPKVQPQPITLVEPEIKTVEVKVPDPEVVAQLTAAEKEIAELHKKISSLEESNTKLQGEVSDAKSELSSKSAKVGTLEATNNSLTEQLQTALAGAAGGAVIAAAVTSDGVDASVHAQLKADMEKQTKDFEHQMKEKEKEYEQKLKEKEKQRKQIEKDMKKILKMQAKSEGNKKSDQELENLKILLAAVVLEAQTIHKEVIKAAEKVDEKLEVTKKEIPSCTANQQKAEESVKNWVTKFTEENGKTPAESDRDAEAQKLYTELDNANKATVTTETSCEALTMLKTGVIPEKWTPSVVPVGSGSAGSSSEEIEKLEKQISDLEDKVSDLEDKISDLTSERDEAKEEVTSLQEQIKELEEKKSDLESQLELAQAQVSIVPTSSGEVRAAVEGDGYEDAEFLSSQLSELQEKLDASEAALMAEQAAHEETREELASLKKQLESVKDDLENAESEAETKLNSTKKALEEEIKMKEQSLEDANKRIEELEKERLSNIPIDTATELKDLKNKLSSSEKEKDAALKTSVFLTSQLSEMKDKVAQKDKTIHKLKGDDIKHEAQMKELRQEKDKQIKKLSTDFANKEKQRAEEEKKKIGALEKKIRDLEAGGGAAKPTARAGKAGPDPKTESALKRVQEQYAAVKKENAEKEAKLKQLDAELKKAKAEGGPSAQDKQNAKKQEKVLKELEKKLEMFTKKSEKQEENIKKQEEEIKQWKKDHDELEKENKKMTAELSTLGVAAKEGMEMAQKAKDLEKEVKKLSEENKVLSENFNSERVLRKKYYNMVEDMKGKIRVYCRARPMSKSEMERGNYSVLKSPDEYSVNVDSSRGLKEFQFDSIFMPEHTQEKVFEDTNNLIQSAVDGYNVCIFAYGQTGSGKTFTMIGDREQNFPGIAPRAFNRIFELIEENKSKFTFNVSVYMLELYNEKLLDLFGKKSEGEEKMEIKKDKKGLVFVQGAVVQEASNAKELYHLFEEGSKNRHVASTKMNAESSRSHLVIAVIIESTNKTSGTVMRGKLSLVDLAGSERVAKTGATAEQLKEANSINKSLSALGDVISALSSEQSFIPYRNNKLTLLMQDSLGGNAKTLMFVNISPADYNVDETIISLTYASRVKLITNDASKNADNKEIARLKSVISKLKAGESVAEEEAA